MGEGSTQNTQEKARVRRNKKPEIQLYRPGALRSRRSNSSSDLPPQSHDNQNTKPNTLEEVNEDRQKNDVARRTSVKGRREKKSTKEVVAGKGGDTREEKRSVKEMDRILPNKEEDKKSGVMHSSIKTEERLSNSKSQKEHFHAAPDSNTTRDVLLTKENRHPQLTRHSGDTDPRPEPSVKKNERKSEEKITSIPLDDRAGGRKNTNTLNQGEERMTGVPLEDRGSGRKNRDSPNKDEERIKSIPLEDKGIGRMNTNTSNHVQQEHHSEKSLGVKTKADNPTARLFGKSLIIQNEKNVPERKSVKREERRHEKPVKQHGTEAAAKIYTEKHFTPRPSSQHKSSTVQHGRPNRNNRSNKPHYLWTPEIVLPESDQRNTPEKSNINEDKPHFAKSPVITETIPQNDPPRGKAGGKAAEDEGKPAGPRHSNKYKYEGSKPDNNKETYEQSYSKREDSRGSKGTQKMHDKTGPETLPDIGSLRVKDSDSKGVQELTAKVDQLVCNKNMGKNLNSKKKGRGWSDYQIETKDYFHADFKKGTLLEFTGISESPEKGKTGNKGEDKVSPISPTTKESIEKTPRAKSYSSARENRRKRGKTHSPGNLSSNQKEELDIEVTVNRDTHERVAHLPQKHELSPNDHGKPQQGRGGPELPSNKKAEEASSQPQKGTLSLKSRSPRYNKPSASVQGEKFGAGRRYDSEDDGVDNTMVTDTGDDWGKEVDHDMTWCNQPEGKGRLHSWEDEKVSWRTRRVKHHSEGEEPPQRVESPGRRGLIQLSTATSGTAAPEPVVPHQSATPPTVKQKHLYNPNNPSKPVAVVPSARDLPVSRETQRGGSWGSSGEGASGSSHQQGGPVSEYHMEGSNTKVDPSLLYSISKGEMDISYYVSSNQLPVEFRRILDIRRHLQGCYRQLLLSDIRLCQEKNIEGSLWKALYYIIIEKLREYINRDPSLKERSLATLLMLVEEGLRYLQELLEALQREYGFTLEDYLEEEGEVRGRVRMALLSAQKLLLSLGDLARYREQYNASPNYNVAKK